MVISYTQNLYFRIQCKKSRNIITIHFYFFIYFKEFTQESKYENHYKSLYFSCLLKTSIKIKQKIPRFVAMKSNNKIKFVVCKKKSVIFATK